MPKFTTHQVYLFVLIFIAAVLRFWGIFELPLTHDELSSIFRSSYSSFSEVFQRGLNDGHPIGTQAFLYFWMKWFGQTTEIVRLPFILMGIGCVPVMYDIGNKLYSKDAGLISATFMVSLQTFVAYSTIARPYMMGLFFTLLYLLMLVQLITAQTNKRFDVKVVLSAILFGALTAYTHYIAFFTIIVISLILLLCNLRLWKSASFITIGIALLYLPHLQHTIHHLSLKGITWSGAPRLDFLQTYLSYAFNQAIWCPIILILIFAFTGRYKAGGKLSIRALILAPFVVFLTTFLYSKHVAPVIQYSVLIFVLPLLLIAVFSVTKPLSNFLRSGIVGFILITNIYQLFAVRVHYDVFEKQLFHSANTTLNEHCSKLDKEDVLVINYANPKYLGYYNDTVFNQIDLDLFQQDQNSSALYKRLLQSNANHLVLIQPSLQHLSIAQLVYPFLKSRVDAQAGTTYVFGKTDVGSEQCVLYDELLDRTVSTKSAIHRSWKGNMSEFTTRKSVLIEYSYVMSDLLQPEHCLPTIELKKDDVMVDYINHQCVLVKPDSADFCYYCSVAMRLQNSIKAQDILNNFEIEVSVNNYYHQPIQIQNERLTIYEDNPIIYSFLEPFSDESYCW